MSDADFDRMRQAQAERNAAGKKGANGLDSAGQRTNSTKASLTETFDKEVYGDEPRDKFAGYNTSIAADDDEVMGDGDEEDGGDGRLVGQYTATSAQMNEWAQGGTAEEDILQSREKQAQIASRETDYQKRRFRRSIDGEAEGESYKESMQRRELEREEERVTRMIEEQQKEKIAKGEDEDEMDGVEHQAVLTYENGEDGAQKDSVDEFSGRAQETKPKAKKRRWDTDTSTEAPATNGQATSNGHAANGETAAKKSRWDSAAVVNGEAATSKKRSKWDAAPSAGASSTPAPTVGMATPAPPVAAFGTDISSRNAPLSDEELDEMLPSEGYKILQPPPGFEPLRAPARRVAPAATPVNTGGFMMQEPVDARSMGKQLPSDIPGAVSYTHLTLPTIYSV